MSQENVEIVRRMCQAFARGEWDEAFEPLDPHVEWDASTHYPWPDSETFKGLNGVRDFFRRFLGTWETYEAEFEEFIDAEDSVVVILSERGTGKGSGVEVRRTFAQVWTLRDGKAVSFTAYLDRASALEAVGLSEQDAYADS